MKVIKGFVVLLVILVSLIVIIGSCSDTEEEPVAEPEVEVTPEEEPTNDTEDYRQMVLEMLQESYAGFATVELDSEEKTFYITPYEDEGVLSDLVAAQEGDPDAVQAWNETVEAFIDFSNIIKDNLPGYVLALRNPANPELILLSVSDGNVLYNFVE